MKTGNQLAGYVDEVWWPRSNDLTVELPKLLVALVGNPGRVERIAYDPDGWAPAQRTMSVDGRRIRMEGIHGAFAHIVLVTEWASTSVQLLVILPETTLEKANRTIATAVHDHPEADARDLLTDQPAQQDVEASPVRQSRS